jgi:hypothetical protein
MSVWAGSRAGHNETAATTPLAHKLGIAPGARVAALGAPPGFEAALDGAATPRTRLRGRFDVIVVFADSLAAVRRRVDAAADALEPHGGLWIAWRKRSSGGRSDVDEPAVRELGLATGLVDNKVCAIDDTWSALRFVRRRGERG